MGSDLSEPKFRMFEAGKKHFLDGHRRCLVLPLHEPPDTATSFGCKSKITP